MLHANLTLRSRQDARSPTLRCALGGTVGTIASRTLDGFASRFVHNRGVLIGVNLRPGRPQGDAPTLDNCFIQHPIFGGTELIFCHTTMFGTWDMGHAVFE